MATLTIDVDEDLLRRVTDVAAARGETIEAAVERLLRVIAMPRMKPEDMPPNLRAVRGILPPLTDEEDKRIIDEERMRKYGGG
jgi:hypothetical protein